MIEPRDRWPARWREAPILMQATFCRNRIRIAAIALLASGLAATLVWPPRPLLVWNASASSPVGLYRVSPADDVARGDIVVAWAPPAARAMAAQRHYLPGNVPLVKHVAAVTGDWVCTEGDMIFVNDDLVARRLRRDPSGRPLPWWAGCRALVQGETFLLMPAGPTSFDGRYFGITQASDIVGKARLIWRG